MQGKIAEFTDAGIPVHFFTGNHDMWAFDYLPKELGVILHYEPFITSINGKKLFIGHGDGLGPGDYGYKRFKKIFKNSAGARVFPCSKNFFGEVFGLLYCIVINIT